MSYDFSSAEIVVQPLCTDIWDVDAGSQQSEDEPPWNFVSFAELPATSINAESTESEGVQARCTGGSAVNDVDDEGMFSADAGVRLIGLESCM